MTVSVALYCDDVAVLKIMFTYLLILFVELTGLLATTAKAKYHKRERKEQRKGKRIGKTKKWI